VAGEETIFREKLKGPIMFRQEGGDAGSDDVSVAADPKKEKKSDEH